jgi:hypothetical protein
VFNLVWSPPEPNDLVWVETSWLRQILASRPEGGAADNLSLVQRSAVKCPHFAGGMHPRTARKGKLMPRNVYDKLVELVAAERNASGSEGMDEVTTEVWTPDSVLCDLCSDTYRSDLADRLNHLKKLLAVVTSLDSGEISLRRDSSDVNFTDLDRYAFVVSRKFSNDFRSSFDRFSRMVEDSCRFTPCSGLNQDIEHLSEGLDALFMDCPAWFGLCEMENVDPCVNTNVTCTSGCSLSSKSFQ